MHNRFLAAGIGIALVTIAMAGLLGVLNSLSSTKPTATTGGPSAVAGSSETPKVSGSDLSKDISPEGKLLPHIPLFDISGAAKTSLLRNIAASVFNGNTWKSDQDTPGIPYNGGKISPPVSGYSRQSTDEIKVTPLEKYASGPVTIPTSLYPTSLSSSQPLIYLPDDQVFISEQGMPETYSFQATHYQFDEARLNAAMVDPEDKYLQLPPEITERTKQLASDITRGIQSPYQKAKAIENYLKTNYTYDLNYKNAPQGQEPDDWFLFNEKKGVCENFNSAFVVLARSAGLPSRLVTGYAISPNAGEQTVYADQAHAWSEVKFRDLGWITFDATGSGPGPVATVTEITSVNPLVLKGHSFSVQGTVKAQNGDPVDGVPIEIFVNLRKDTTGGVLVGQGTVTGGNFNIEAIIPEETKVGDYQLLAHCLGGIRYQHSWSDPQIKITTGTQISLNTPQRVRISEPVNIQGTLAEELKQPISGQRVDLFLNNQLVAHLSTDKNGQFNWKQAFSQAGNYTIKASFTGNTYYLQSSQEVSFQVLIPTSLNLQVPQKAKAKDSLSLSGLLTEEVSGKPVPDQSVQIFIDGKPISNKVLTGRDGAFKTEYAFGKEGIHQVEARFNSVPYYWESQAGAVIEILPPSGSFPWTYPVIAGILVVFGLGGFYFYQRQRRQPLPVAPSITRIPEPLYEPVKEERKENGINLKLEFPQIEFPFPDVWGLDEELVVICLLHGPNGKALAAKPLEIMIGNQPARITTDDAGTGHFQCSFSKKGQYKLAARYKGESTSEDTVSERLIRIVDYREEIVDLYKDLLVWLRNLGIDLAPRTTPREVEELVLRCGKDISVESLDKVVNYFEEADYSLHSIARKQYKGMYLAQKEMREYEPSPKVSL